MRAKVTWTLISIPRTRSSGIDQLIRGFPCWARGGGGQHGAAPASHELAQRAERGPDLFREEPRFLPRREVTAPLDLVEVDDVGVRVLDPAARSAPDLAGEGGETDRNLDRRRRLAGRLCLSQ